jgi:hypothetical protein
MVPSRGWMAAEGGLRHSSVLFGLEMTRLLTPVRLRIGIPAENGRGRDWYRAAAGLINGWRRRLVEPPGASGKSGQAKP